MRASPAGARPVAAPALANGAARRESSFQGRHWGSHLAPTNGGPKFGRFERFIGGVQDFTGRLLRIRRNRKADDTKKT